MITPLTLDAEALASLAPTREAPVAWTIDDDGSSIYVRLPAPRRLAEFVTIPGAMRDGASVVRDGVLLSILDLAATLRVLLADLPDRDAVYVYYDDLRTAARAKSGRMGSYTQDVIRAVRTGLDPVPAPPPAPAKPRVPPKTGAQRVKDHRDRKKVNAYASVVEWLEVYLTDEETTDRGWCLGDALYAECITYLEASYDPGDYLAEEPEHIVAARPTRQEFYAVLDGVLDFRRRTKKGAAYLIPEKETA